jgi:hypothetical protein
MARAIVVMLTATLLPTIASGADLGFSFAGAVEYDSNVYRVPDDSDRSKKDDVIFRFTPRTTLTSDEGDFTYRLMYSVPFEQGVDSNKEISDFDQIGRAELGYRLGDNTQFTVSNVTRYARSTTRPLQEDVASGDLAPNVNSERSRILRSESEFAAIHNFAPRLSGNFRAGYSLFDTEQRDRSDTFTLSGTAGLNYVVDPKHTAGGGVSSTLQHFDDQPGLPGSDSYFYNIFASWVYRFDETTTITLSAGPTIIQTDQDRPKAGVSGVPVIPYTTLETDGGDPSVIGVSQILNCPVNEDGPNRVITNFDKKNAICGSFNSLGVLDRNDPSQAADFMTVTETLTDVAFPGATRPGKNDDLSVNGFGQARITKRWTPNVLSEASYRRQQSTASGIGGSTILDSIVFLTDWKIDEFWDVGVRFDWTKRNSVSKLNQTVGVVVPDGQAVPPIDLTNFAANSVAVLQGDLQAIKTNNTVDTERWGVGGRISRKIGRNLEAALRLRYNKQSSKSRSRGSASDFDNYLAILGIRYTFAPIEVW